MKRREFIKYGVGSLLTAPLVHHRGLWLYADNYASPIVSVLDKLATSVSYKAGKKANTDGVIVDKILSFDILNMRVARMVDTAVMKITGQNSVGKAWESLFPAGHPNENTRIGVKLNFSYGDRRNDKENDWSTMVCPFGPKTAVTNAIVTGLAQMLDGTFPVENITLFERMYSIGFRKYYPIVQGYRPVLQSGNGLFKDARPGACRLHWIKSSSPLELPDDAPEFIAAPDFPEKFQAPQRIYSGVYEHDFLINYIIAKDHREAGITGAMKNNYGCTDNPMGTHGLIWNDEQSPYAGSKRCSPVFYKHVNQQAPYILNLLDALVGVHHGGALSGKVFQANTIAVSKDPVALDTYQLGLINQVRHTEGLGLISTEDIWHANGHPNASFLRRASEKHELGSMSQDDLRSYDLSAEPDLTEIPILQNSLSRMGEIRRENKEYRVELFMDRSGREHSIESRIEDSDRNVIRSLGSSSTISTKAELRWDHKDNSNSLVKEGIYTWYVKVDGLLHSGTINDKII
ncbi:MAG: DUF362 domain-containing protein [Bacteroidota bacterium]